MNSCTSMEPPEASSTSFSNSARQMLNGSFSETVLPTFSTTLLPLSPLLGVPLLFPELLPELGLFPQAAIDKTMAKTRRALNTFLFFIFSLLLFL